MLEPEFLLLAALDVALILVALRAPWASLVGLLFALPFNGFIVNVVRRQLDIDGPAGFALAGWHDALLLGIAAAALLTFVRAPRRLTIVEGLAAAVLLIGVVYVVASPFLLTATYAYRTLYEPIILLVAVGQLARAAGLPEWLPRRAALAMVSAAVIAAVFTWWQVYVGGFYYLDLNYHDPGETLASAYTATFIHQPRGVGTFHGPNEFGAYLAISTILLVVPGVLRIPLWVRAWALAAIGLALLLSFSRSGWLSTSTGVVLALWLSRPWLPSRQRIMEAVRRRSTQLRIGPPLAAVMILTALIFTSSGAPRYVGGTVTGEEPSAGGRPDSAADGVRHISVHPFGTGLGTAGPKSTRFGESGGAPLFNSETWYLNYAVQVGLPGAVALAALVAAIGLTLWRGRREPWARAAMGAAAGLGTGALFIPIVEDPSVAVPLFAVTALALVLALEGSVARQPQPVESAAGEPPAGAVVA